MKRQGKDGRRRYPPPRLLTLQEVLELLGSHVVLEAVDVDEDELCFRHNGKGKGKLRDNHTYTRPRVMCALDRRTRVRRGTGVLGQTKEKRVTPKGYPFWLVTPAAIALATL